MFLPVPNGQDKSVHVRMQGRSVPAVYLTKGLEQFWYFGQSTYITLRPDGTAVYMDFDGAEPEELRKPKSVFFCE